MRHHRGAGRRAQVSAIVAAIATVVAACGSGDGRGTAAHPVVQVSTGVAGWGDDHRHVVVLTDAAAARAALVPDATPDTTPDTTPEVASQPPVPAAEDGRTFEVHRSDGTVDQVDVPDESLVAAAPGAADVAALDAAGPGALLVVDVGGVIGAVGVHYVLIGTVLEEIAGTGDEAGAEPAVTEPAVTGMTVDEPAVDEPAVDEPATSVPATSVPADDEAMAAALSEVPGVVSVELRGPGVFAVATDGDPDALAAVPGVASVGEDVVVGLFDDPRQGEQWYLANTGAAQQAGGYTGVAGADLGALQAWQVSEGAGTIVAVIDSGVDIDHTDFTGRIWSNSDEVCSNGIDDDHNGFVDDCRGWDFGGNDANPRPDAGVQSSNHGTHVAGIVAAGRNGVGVVGVAPGATIMPLKVMAPNGVMSTSAIYAAMLYAADNGATVVNLSLGTEPGVYSRAQMSMFEAGIADARSNGVTVVVAAGNSGVDTTTRAVWPAEFSRWYDNQITVSASTNSDTRASFSNWGAATNVWAPGWFLMSTLPGSTWGFMSGTSMAAPAVAGVVAAVRSSGTATTPAAIRQQLLATAASVAAGPRVDMAMAVGARQPASVSVSVAGADAVLADQPGSLGVTVAATGAPAAATGVRISLAAAVGSAVYAVGGVEAAFRDAGGTWATATTGDDGAFPVQPVRDATSLAATGWAFAADLTLPSGDYAVVVELVDDAGSRLGKAKVSYLTVSDTPPGTPTTAPPGSSSTTTVPGPTVPGSPSTTTVTGPTVPGPTVPGTTVPGPVPTSPAPTSPAPTSPGGVPATSSPAAGGGAPVTTSWSATTAPPAGAPATTLPPPSGGAPATTSWSAPTTTGPAPVTTAAPATTSWSASTTTAATTTAPVVTTAPPSTTPAPLPDRDGSWAVTAMSPRLASTVGGTWLTIEGNFPTEVPVYVWFGELGIVEAESFGDVLLLQSPGVARADVTDVLVRFRTDHDVVLTLTRAFTFVAPAGPPATTAPATTAPGTTAPATTPPAPGGGGGSGGTPGTAPAGGGGSTPTTPGAPGTAPATSAPVPTAPATSAPVTTSPANTSPATTSPATGGGTATTAPTTVAPGPRLRPRPATGAMSTLQLATWPRPGCRSAACPAADLG